MHCGTDIVQISRIADMAARHGRSLGRFFTEQELAYCQRNDGTWRAESLAGIFAAKEALFKALGTGFRQGKWTDVEVCHDSLGAPYISSMAITPRPWARIASCRPCPSPTTAITPSPSPC